MLSNAVEAQTSACMSSVDRPARRSGRGCRHLSATALMLAHASHDGAVLPRENISRKCNLTMGEHAVARAVNQDTSSRDAAAMAFALLAVAVAVAVLQHESCPPCLSSVLY